MNILVKFLKSLSSSKNTATSDSTLYCNDPIAIKDLGRRIEHKEAFFNLYVRCSCESRGSFHVYLANMIRHCRLHMFSLPVEDRQSFFDYCLVNKVDISHRSLEVANQNERAANAQMDAVISVKN